MDGLIRSLNGFHKLGEEIVFLELLRLHIPRRFLFVMCGLLHIKVTTFYSILLQLGLASD